MGIALYGRQTPLLPMEKQDMPINFQKPLLALAVLSSLPISAMAIDVDAGDYTAAPDGTTLGLIYLQHADRTNIYAQDKKAVSGAGLRSEVGIARLIHFMNVGGYIVDPQILIPFGSLQGHGATSALGSASGIGDVILAATLWTINDPANKEYLGFTPFVYAPTGSYDKNSTLSFGENRWRYAFQVGYIKEILPKLTLDALADVTLYGDNTEYSSAGATLKQDATYSTQFHIRYQITPSVDARINYNLSWNGEQTIGNQVATPMNRVQKFSIGAGWWATPKDQFIVTAGKDAQVTNGFQETSRVNVRYARVF